MVRVRVIGREAQGFPDSVDLDLPGVPRIGDGIQFPLEDETIPVEWDTEVVDVAWDISDADPKTGDRSCRVIVWLDGWDKGAVVREPPEEE